MIDLKASKSAGWARIVSELSASADDERAFLPALVGSLGHVSGARQSALLSVAAGDQEEAHAELVWPTTQGQATVAADESLVEPEAVRGCVRAAAEAGTTQVFGLRSGDGLYSSDADQGFVVCVPVQRVEGGASTRVVSMLLDARSKEALQTTLAVVELLAGYAHLGAARQQLSRTRSAGAALDLATRLIGSINASRSFKGASMQLVNDLARHLKADRVALGWRGGLAGAAAGALPDAEGTRDASVVPDRDSTPVRVVAMSDTEHVDRRMAMVRKIAAAMDECVDQEQAVVHPLPEVRPGQQADPVLSRALTTAHRELAASDANLKLASLPIRDGGETLGVITIESAAPGQTIEVGTVELLQATLDLVGPVLRLRRSDDRPVPARVVDSARRSAAWLVGPRHTLWKLAGAAVVAALLASVLVSVPYRVEASISLRPIEKRVVSVPYDGSIREVTPLAEAGTVVSAGDVLARLDTSELELSAVEARGQVQQAEAQADEAIRRGEGAARQQAEAQAAQARARLELFEGRIADAAVRAPIDGTIIAGDLSDRVGARLSRGEVLFEIAPLDRMRVVAKVDDRDIGLVSQAMADGGLLGSVATRAYPDRRYPMRVDRVVPLAQAGEGANTYDVYATLDESAAWMRPGMEGLAKLDVGDRRLIWIATRRITDSLRLWLWW
ncbi:MAG: HlyD family efflux transporter periplasmic adaptor subunit [Planctomycetota bacterium]